MDVSTLPPPSLIQTEKELDRVVRDLSSQPQIAVDTESNSLFAYQEQVCLIQFSTPEQDYLLDPLALPNLATLEPIFMDASIQKVLHGAEYDIMCLRRDFNFTVSNLFDTRVACRTLGWQQSGLSNLLEKVFNLHIDKRFQRANWGKRPLPAEMLDYARYDTHYLLKLRDHLTDELEREDRVAEAHELCQQMTQIEPRENGFDPEGFWRITNAKDLSKRQRAVLRELYQFRDKNAQKYNRPAFKIMGDKVLIDVAMKMPTKKEDLEGIHGMTSGQIHRFGTGILDCVQRGKNAPIPKPPKNKKMSEQAHSRYEALHDWRKALARKREVESDIILPRDTLREIALLGPTNFGELHDIMMPLEWRFQTYGEDILKTISRVRDHS